MTICDGNTDICKITEMLYECRNDLSGTDNGNTNGGRNLERFRNFMDFYLVPSRIENAVNLAYLISEQADLRNKNKTLTEYQKAQLKVIDRIISDFHNKGYTSLRSVQSLDYRVNEKKFQARFVRYTFMLVSVIGILGGITLLNPSFRLIAQIIGILLIIIYTILLYLNIRQNMLRYKYDWEKLYWKSPKKFDVNDCDKDKSKLLQYILLIGLFTLSIVGIIMANK